MELARCCSVSGLGINAPPGRWPRRCSSRHHHSRCRRCVGLFAPAARTDVSGAHTPMVCCWVRQRLRPLTRYRAAVRASPPIERLRCPVRPLFGRALAQPPAPPEPPLPWCHEACLCTLARGWRRAAGPGQPHEQQPLAAQAVAHGGLLDRRDGGQSGRPRACFARGPRADFGWPRVKASPRVAVARCSAARGSHTHPPLGSTTD